MLCSTQQLRLLSRGWCFRCTECVSRCRAIRRDSYRWSSSMSFQSRELLWWLFWPGCCVYVVQQPRQTQSSVHLGPRVSFPPSSHTSPQPPSPTRAPLNPAKMSHSKRNTSLAFFTYPSPPPTFTAPSNQPPAHTNAPSSKATTVNKKPASPATPSSPSTPATSVFSAPATRSHVLSATYSAANARSKTCFPSAKKSSACKRTLSDG